MRTFLLFESLCFLSACIKKRCFCLLSGNIVIKRPECRSSPLATITLRLDCLYRNIFTGTYLVSLKLYQDSAPDVLIWLAFLSKWYIIWSGFFVWRTQLGGSGSDDPAVACILTEVVAAFVIHFSGTTVDSESDGFCICPFTGAFHSCSDIPEFNCTWIC